MTGTVAYALLRKYVNDTLVGMGALKGAPCEVQSIDKVDGTTTVTLKWTDTTGTDHTQSFDIEDGISIVSVEVNTAGNLIIELSDGTSIDCGKINSQFTELPTPGVDNVGSILQYVGPNTADYTKGYFYECILDGGVYKWVQKDVQPGSGGGGSSKMYIATLLAANWVSGAQTVTINGITPSQNGVIGMLDGATDAEIAAARKALITVTSVNTNAVTFKCEQTPAVDITFGVLIPGGGGGGTGGDAELERDVTSNLAVGAIASNTTLPQGTTFTEFVEKLLITEIAPTISFSITKSGNVAHGSSYIETLTVGVTNMGTARSIDTIEWYEGSTLLQTDTIGSTTTGSWSYTMATATTDTTTFKAIVKYKKSNGSQVTTTKTASITFYYDKFHGSVASLTPSEADVTALTSDLATAKGATYTFTVSAARIAYAYPKSLGALTSIKDGNNFDITGSFTMTTETYTRSGASVDYYLYVLTDATTVSGYKVTFA